MPTGETETHRVHECPPSLQALLSPLPTDETHYLFPEFASPARFRRRFEYIPMRTKIPFSSYLDKYRAIYQASRAKRHGSHAAILSSGDGNSP